MPSPALREVQRGFWQALARGGEPATPGVVGRFGVYGDAYVWRLQDVLREDYPRLARALGARFADVALGYIRAQPSEHPSVRHFGARLPAYLAARGDLPPCLTDLARLELARTDAFDAADGPLLTTEALRAVEPEAWPGLRFAPVPSLRVLRLAWPAHRLWSGDADAASLRPRTTTLRVWRAPDDAVLHAVVEPRPAAVLRRLVAGEPFMRLCEVYARCAPEDGAASVVGLLARWLEDGVLAERQRG